MALNDLELHALDFIMEEAVKRHLEGWMMRRRAEVEGGVGVGVRDRDGFDGVCCLRASSSQAT